MTGCDLDSRFGGIRRVYGAKGAQAIAGLHVCVVGIGGVGSWSVEALARTGVGQISLIDNDSVCVTNTNRQIHALDSTLGQSKVAVMARRVSEINPACRLHAIDDFLTMATLEDYLSQGYDYVIDAIDSIKFKAAMIDFCRRRRLPVVTTGGAGGMTDPSLIRVADLSKTFNDPLASKVRSTLRRQYGFPRTEGKRFGVECVFSSEQPVYPQADGSVSHRKPGIHGVSLDCRFGYGSASTVTAVFGFVAASRAINRSLQRLAARQAAESGGVA
jgi:tRNA A37 threonylcarbamoyladenosine dehydratase